MKKYLFRSTKSTLAISQIRNSKVLSNITIWPFTKICIYLCTLSVFCFINCFNGNEIFTNECHWPPSLDSLSEGIMTCRVKTIQHAAKYNHKSLEFVRTLNIACDDVSYENILSNATFEKFTHVQALKIENCNVPSLPDYAFVGLNNLKNLSIQSRQINLRSVGFSSGTFSDLQELEQLELGHNGIVTVPSNMFCELGNLKILNLTYNELDDARNLGLIPAENLACLPEILVLDLSHNILKSIPDNAFSSLRTLKVLFLNDNQLSELYPYAFSGLNRLISLDLSNNRISHLPEQIFQDSTDILDLYLQNNSLNALTPRVFRGLRQLVGLNLSHNALESVSSLETLSDLSRLVVLDLNHNHFHVVNASFFHLVRSLQIMYLSFNEIQTIADHSFATLQNLHTLTLAGNKLKQIGSFTFSGLESLNYISLNDNEIEDVPSGAFDSCRAVQNLRMRSNRLTYIPNAIHSLKLLKHLDLANNKIRALNNMTFEGLKNIVSLHLSRNEIGNITKGCLRDLTALKTLDLSHNEIQSLGHGSFDDVPELRIIRVNDNKLVDVNGLFMNLRYLHTLNISRNFITWFDYALVPTELKILDIHDNEIDGLGNYFELETLMQLHTLDASYNVIREITFASLPNSIEVVSFRNNKISKIGAFTFMEKTNLTFVDLRGNALRELDINSLRLKSVPESRELPDFLLSNNTLNCDCSMEWLQRVNYMDDSRHYPKIEDLDDVLCHMVFPRLSAVLPLSRAKSSDFLCKYGTHCFALCHCCEFDACDCEMVCPENCTCYSDQTWNTNMVDCSIQGYSHVPHRIPMDVTDLYLDGNDMSRLGGHAFIGRKNMRVLHLNNSNINIIRNQTFNGLQHLLILHLESNHISFIEGHEFKNLTKLQELYLSHNRITSVNNSSFSHLKFLQVLFLDHNHITAFQIWNLNYNRQLVRLKIGHNRWNCQCYFIEKFQTWITKHRAIVLDGARVRCAFNNSTVMSLTEFTNATCSNFSVVPYTSAEFVGDYMPVVIVAPTLLFLVVLLSVIFWKQRNELKMWMYSKYGLRLFEKDPYASDNGEKLFDAFLSYCKKDEAFVSQMLSPELECGAPPHRLCLRYRDLPMSGYVAEAISEAIECSHCSIAVISEQYLKSEWCLYELKACHHESQCNRRHKVIIVLLDKLNFKELETDVRICFRSAVVVHWGDKRFWEKLRYVLPDGRFRNHHVNCSDAELSSSLRRSSLSNTVKLV